MLANNEIGTIQPVAEIGKLAKAKGILFHTDATEAVGKIPVDVDALRVDLLSFSAHKIYGPKGWGCTCAGEPAAPPRAAPDGGGLSRGCAGTLNVPGVVGFGVASRSHSKTCLARAWLTQLRDRLDRDPLALEGVTSAATHGAPPTR
jgi:cysteine desulfurase